MFIVWINWRHRGGGLWRPRSVMFLSPSCRFSLPPCVLEAAVRSSSWPSTEAPWWTGNTTTYEPPLPHAEHRLRPGEGQDDQNVFVYKMWVYRGGQPEWCPHIDLRFGRRWQCHYLQTMLSSSCADGCCWQWRHAIDFSDWLNGETFSV